MSFTWQNFNLIKYDVPGDGHCLFHALLLGFFLPYIEQTYNNNEVSRLSIVKQLRSDLADRLAQPVPGKRIRYYDQLYDNNINTFAQTVNEFTLNNMTRTLRSDEHIGYGYLEFICNQMNKDIYIIDDNSLYKSDETKFLIKNRNSIVLYYKDNHYQLIGLEKDDCVITHFKPTDDFILHLQSLI